MALLWKHNVGVSDEAVTEFVKRAHQVHNYRYTYPGIDKGLQPKIGVRCPEHSIFYINRRSHLAGRGCPLCGRGHVDQGVGADVTARFVNKAETLYPGKYDYSKAVYRNSNTPIIVTCPAHGDFTVAPKNFLNGRPCPSCAAEERIAKNLLSSSEFVELAQKQHGSKYSYPMAGPLAKSEQVRIICTNCGPFLQKVGAHLAGKGCPSCAVKQRGTAQKERAAAVFVERAIEIHGEKYSYGKATYRGSHHTIVLTCHVHGDFTSTPAAVLAGAGCKGCFAERSSSAKKMNWETFIQRATAAHGDKYQYEAASFTGYRDKIAIICPQHGPYNKTVKRHLAGSGCNKCAANTN